MKVLVTGAAGFIGMHVAQILLKRGDTVVGIDNLNDYYDPKLKLARLEQLKPYPNFKFVRGDIADRATVEDLFAAARPAGRSSRSPAYQRGWSGGAGSLSDLGNRRRRPAC
jgi:UDP-glucuronate 4-epimerase